MFCFVWFQAAVFSHKSGCDSDQNNSSEKAVLLYFKSLINPISFRPQPVSFVIMACHLILLLEHITKYIFSTLLYGTELFDCPPQNTTKPHHLSYRIIVSLCFRLVVTSVTLNHASPAWQRCRRLLVTSSATGNAIRGFKYKPQGAKHYNIIRVVVNAVGVDWKG